MNEDPDEIHLRSRKPLPQRQSLPPPSPLRRRYLSKRPRRGTARCCAVCHRQRTCDPIAKYRADRVAAALTATQNMTLSDIRRLAWLAEKQDYRWDLLVSLVRSVLDNVSTIEMEHPDPLLNCL
jgi:hypothetical protein